MSHVVTGSGVIHVEKNKPMNADFDSGLMDFRDMPIGSIQAYWSGNDVNTGTVELYVSNLVDENTFTAFPGSLQTMDSGCQAHMFLLSAGVIGFRYAKVRYKANGVSTGVMGVVAVGKKTGGIM
jgi:hypothetical protein